MRKESPTRPLKGATIDFVLLAIYFHVRHIIIEIRAISAALRVGDAIYTHRRCILCKLLSGNIKRNSLK